MHPMSGPPVVYKIVPRPLWDAARAADRFDGSAADAASGFVHLSAADQVAGTAAKHFAGAHDLLLVAISVPGLGAALRWEPSRDGALFPHLYGSLDPAAVLAVTPLPLGPDGRHVLPELNP